MSEGERMLYDLAIGVANEVIELLRPECDKIEIGGSLRRGLPLVGDIEIVAISEQIEIVDMFGAVLDIEPSVNDVVDRIASRKIKDGDRYKQFYYGKHKIDLFLADETNWGLIFMIRTGSATFSKKMMTPKKWGGYMPSNYRVQGGYLRNGVEIISTPTEEELFTLFEEDFILPKDRSI